MASRKPRSLQLLPCFPCSCRGGGSHWPSQSFGGHVSHHRCGLCYFGNSTERDRAVCRPCDSRRLRPNHFSDLDYAAAASTQRKAICVADGHFGLRQRWYCRCGRPGRWLVGGNVWVPLNFLGHGSHLCYRCGKRAVVHAGIHCRRNHAHGLAWCVAADGVHWFTLDCLQRSREACRRQLVDGR